MKTNILFINSPFKIFKYFFCTQIAKPLISPFKMQWYLKLHSKYKRDPLARGIMQAVKSPQPNKSMVISRILSYLQQSAERTPQGLVSVIWAVNQCEDTQIRSYCRHFVEYVLRSEDMSIFSCSKYELQALLVQLSLKRSQAYQKIKQSLIKYKTAEILMANKNIISTIHFYQIIMLLTSTDRMTVTTNSRFLSLAEILSQKIYAHLKLYIEDRMNQSDLKRITPLFINSIMYYFRQYPPVDNNDVKLLLSFLIKAAFQHNKQFKRIILYNSHRCFPYWQKDQKGNYYKDAVLAQIIKRQKKILDPPGQNWNESLLCYSILSFQFYKAMDQIQFRYDEELNYLLKEDIYNPQLPPFFWQKYEKSPEVMNKDHISRNIIKKIYPNRYISTPQVQSSTKKPPLVTQNEVKVRVDLALEKLKLQFKKQVEVSGRYVDFLIGDVIIECDGDHHFNLHRMDYDESTHFRNLHLLLSGYRLLIINIFQYNHNRKTQQLAKLIQKKLETLNKHNAVMIL